MKVAKGVKADPYLAVLPPILLYYPPLEWPNMQHALPLSAAPVLGLLGVNKTIALSAAQAGPCTAHMRPVRFARGQCLKGRRRGCRSLSRRSHAHNRLLSGQGASRRERVAYWEEWGMVVQP
jgi:hypothetical protein